MSYQPPPHRLEALDGILKALDRSSRILLTTHLNADGDGAGSEVALAAWLRSRDKEAWIVNPTPFPDSFGFLLPDPDWSVDAGSNRAGELSRAADLAVVLDTAEKSRIGRLNPLIKDLPRVVVDHHPPGPDPVEGFSLQDPEASATGELLFDLLHRAEPDRAWPPATALGLYVAILTDTGSFRFSNASPRAHRVVAELLERGVDPERTHRVVYGQVPLRKLRLLRASLETLDVDPTCGLAWMTVPTSAYNELSATSDDVEGLVDYPRMVDGVRVGLLFRETARGESKVSFRSNGEVDVNGLARRFGGGGHRKAAGAVLDRPLDRAREEVLAATREALAGEGERRGEGRVAEPGEAQGGEQGRGES